MAATREMLDGYTPPAARLPRAHASPTRLIDLITHNQIYLGLCIKFYLHSRLDPQSKFIDRLDPQCLGTDTKRE
jgi:hypothetical protein